MNLYVKASSFVDSHYPAEDDDDVAKTINQWSFFDPYIADSPEEGPQHENLEFPLTDELLKSKELYIVLLTYDTGHDYHNDCGGGAMIAGVLSDKETAEDVVHNLYSPEADVIKNNNIRVPRDVDTIELLRFDNSLRDELSL